jgi:hypothetical protein
LVDARLQPPVCLSRFLRPPLIRTPSASTRSPSASIRSPSR